MLPSIRPLSLIIFNYQIETGSMNVHKRIQTHLYGDREREECYCYFVLPTLCIYTAKVNYKMAVTSCLRKCWWSTVVWIDSFIIFISFICKTFRNCQSGIKILHRNIFWDSSSRFYEHAPYQNGDPSCRWLVTCYFFFKLSLHH